MTEELKRAYADEVHGGATKRITGTDGGSTQLVAHEQNVEVTQPASGTHTVTLPPVAECKGRIFTFEAPGAGTGSVTVDTKNDDLPLLADQVLNTADAYLVLTSNGTRFMILEASL